MTDDRRGPKDTPGQVLREAATVRSPEIAIMFADVSGSTRLYDRLGDEAALARISHCLDLATALTTTNGGRVVKSIGDEVLCVFATANDAIAAACAIHQALAGPGGVDDGTGNPLAMRIGIHLGAAIVEDGDVFGDAVNVAARMTAQSKAGQVILSGITREEVSPILQSCARYVDRAAVKGKQQPMEMYEFICHPDDATVMAELTLPGARSGPRTLVLECARGSARVDEDHPGILIGRDESCDLVVDELTASRHHLRVEYRKNRFYVVDQSTNGTYIQPDAHDAAYARREELVLEGSGRISLGCSFTREPREVVSYRTEEAGSS